MPKPKPTKLSAAIRATTLPDLIDDDFEVDVHTGEVTACCALGAAAISSGIQKVYPKTWWYSDVVLKFLRKEFPVLKKSAFKHIGEDDDTKDALFELRKPNEGRSIIRLIVKLNDVEYLSKSQIATILERNGL